MAFDFKALGTNDKVALVAGAVTSILTLFPAYAKASVEASGDLGATLGSVSESKSAFVEWATLGALLVIAAFVLVLVRVLGVLPAGVPWNLITAAVAGLGTLILVLYVFTFGPDMPAGLGDSVDISTGPGWSGWLLLLAAIVFTAFCALSFRDSGEDISDFNRGNDAGGATPPPPPPPAS